MNIKHEVTIYDIAAALDISPSTVSRALSGVPLVSKDTRKRILATARQLGYRQNFFASKLRSQQTKMLSGMVPRLNNATASSVISAAESVARRNGYSLIITQTWDAQEEYISTVEHFNQCRVDGLLICNMQNKLINPAIPNHRSPTVIIDNVALLGDETENIDTASRFTKHLLTKGCKNIALIPLHMDICGIDGVFAGCQNAITNSKHDGCRLTIQTRSELLTTINTMLESPDGIIYIGPVLAMLFLPHQGLTCHAHDRGLFDDVPDRFSDKFAGLGHFATEVLLSLIEK